MWPSRSAQAIQERRPTVSTFPREYNSKVPFQAVTPSRLQAILLFRERGDSSLGLLMMGIGNRLQTSKEGPIFSSGYAASRTGSKREFEMGRILLHLSCDVYKEISDHILSDSLAAESAGFLFVVPRTPEDDTQVFEQIEWYPVQPSGFVDRSWYHLELTDEVRAYVIKRAHDLGASIVEFHSHPGSRSAEFSNSDQRGFRDFVPHVWWRLRGRPYFAIVVSQNNFDGLAWMLDARTPQRLDGIVVGEEVLNPTQLSSLGIDSERYDRNVRFFGQPGQNRLAAASVAVVGVGGLGTHVVQQLALLGVGRLVLIDPEEVEETNRNRYIGLRNNDPVPGLPKVKLGRRLAKEINPEVQVVSISSCLRSEAAFEVIIRSDYVFGCLDSDGPRLVLNELCLAYTKPYFDLASDILDDGVRYGGRLCVVDGGSGCLVCHDEIDIAVAQVDLMSDEQRRDHASIYGIPSDALGAVGPSVVSINGVMASLGVTEFMLMATGVPRSPRNRLKYHGARGIVTVVTGDPEPGCYYCSELRGKEGAAGLGRYLTNATQK